jgi:TatD DNase family protein
MMELVDTHCHLYDPAFDSDRWECVQRARAAGVVRVLLPNVDDTTVGPMLSLFNSDETFFGWMSGLHPCSLPDDEAALEKALHNVEKLLQHKGAVAVGEIGLDFHWRKDNLAQQRAVFARQCHMALKRGLPVAVHSRNAVDDVLDVLTSSELAGLRGVLHCFTGNVEQARRAVEAGFYLGIGGVLTFKNSGLDEVIRAVPQEFIVLETDAPYLAPTPHRGKRNEPAYLSLVVSRLAEVWTCTPAEAAAFTTANANRLFQTL